MGDSHVFFLIRISKREYIEDLYYNGGIQLNPIKWYEEDERNDQRGDKAEGTFRFRDINHLTISQNGVQLAQVTNANVVLNGVIGGCALCMYAITGKLVKQTSWVDSRVKGLGEAFVIIREPRIFTDRICDALEAIGHKTKRGLVRYYRKNYKGVITPFFKPWRFKHQNEYRIFFPTKIDEPVMIRIGSIEDIASIHSIEELDQLRWEFGE